MTTAQDSGKVASLMHWLPLPPGPQCNRQDYFTEEFP